jgi:hypothetical protein
MNMHLKEIGHHANPRHWSGFTWTIAIFVLLCAVGTAVVGVKLYRVTDREVGFNTR